MSAVTQTRQTPLATKRTKPRRVAATCSVQRCNRRPAVLDLCKTHATRKADKLFADAVKRGGICQLAPHIDRYVVFACAGPLECCHWIPRNYRAVRWEFWNADAACAAHHRWYDTHPLQKDAIAEERMGAQVCASLRRKAITDRPADLAEVLTFVEGLQRRLIRRIRDEC